MRFRAGRYASWPAQTDHPRLAVLMAAEGVDGGPAAAMTGAALAAERHGGPEPAPGMTMEAPPPPFFAIAVPAPPTGQRHACIRGNPR
jgi:hypothetical protein